MSKKIGLTCAATLLATTALASATGTTLAASAAAAGQPEWIRQFGTPVSDIASAVAIGPDGRVHVVGYTWGAIGADKAGVDAFVVTFDADGTELWRRQPGGTGADYAFAAATDAAGNLYVVGSTTGALAGTPKGIEDAFVIKFDADGHILWKRQPGTSRADTALAVATDAAGNVFVAGSTEGALGGSYKKARDPFLIKFDADGRILWKRQPGTTLDDVGNGVAADADGNVFLTGWTRGANWRLPDAFVIKYDPDGRPLWKREPATTGDDEAQSAATDADGSVTLMGSTSGSLAGPNQGSLDPFLIRFDRDGSRTWAIQPGTSSGDAGRAGAADSHGNVYLAGDTKGALAGVNQGATDAYVLKYDPTGSLVWGDQAGSTLNDTAVAVGADGLGNVYLVGYTYGALSGNTNQGQTDIFVIKYGPDGPR